MTDKINKQIKKGEKREERREEREKKTWQMMRQHFKMYKESANEIVMHASSSCSLILWILLNAVLFIFSVL